MKRKLTSLVLVAALVASAVPVPPAAAAGADSPALASLNEQLDGHFKKNDQITLLVALEDKAIHQGQSSVPVEKRRDAAEMQEQMDYAQAAREDFYKEMDQAGIRYKVEGTYDIAFTGAALDVKVADAKKIADLKGVKHVEAALLRQTPTLSRPNMAWRQDLSSNKMVEADLAQANSYNGEGALIAVIDSGCDPYHEAMKLTSPSSARFKNVQDIQKCITEKKLAPGAYFSAKIPFGYNYANRSTSIKEADPLGMSHGMHVAGIIAGNSDKLKGVAPEAQLAVMRVFGGGLFGQGTNAELYTKALEDAVKMGVDAVNISIGSPAGSESNVAPVTTEALRHAQEMGIVVSIAAGNNGFYGKDAGQDNRPSADNPDYGLLADPAVAPYSMAVAAVQNMQLATKGLRIINDNRTLHHQPNKIGTLATGQITLVDAGYGHADEFQKVTEKGYYALIQRGSADPDEQFDFRSKIENAEKAGYEGVIMFDNEPDAPLFILEAPGTKIPATLINNADGLYLKDKIKESGGKVTVSFDQDFVFADQPGGGELSDFSSWGMTPAGNLKPDISAPGGGIFSAYNDSQYGNMDGTSMAAPHVAGGLALVKQRVEKDFPQARGEEKYRLIKNLLMSTAAPHKSTETNAYTSPRQQGAGLMQINRALHAKAVIEGTGEINSINIGTDLQTNEVTVPFAIHNYGDSPLTFTVYGHLNTDSVKNGKMVLTPRFLAESDSQEVTVPAGQTVPVSIHMSVPEDIDLAAEMTKGYFLEGFVFAESKDPSTPKLGAPFVGFHGSYKDLKILEPSIYDMIKAGKRPYYYHMGKGDGGAFYTHLGAKLGEKEVVLGQLPNSSYDAPGFEADKIAFSPNGDGAADTALFYGTFLRNYKGLELTVRENDGQGDIIYQVKNPDDQGIKNFYLHPNFGIVPAQNMTTTKGHWSWDGTDGAGRSLPDGHYDLAVQTWGEGMDLKAPGQSLHFPVVLDRTYPRITKAAFDSDRSHYRISDLLEEGSGLRDLYIQDGEKKIHPQVEGQGYSFDLAGLDINRAKVVVSDYAYNTVTLPLAKAERKGNERSVIVNGLAGDKAMPQGSFSWQIQSPDGQAEDAQNLSVGKHVLVITDIDAQYRLIGEKTIPFEITEGDLQKTLTVSFETLFTNEVLITVTNIDKAGVSLIIEDLDNKRTFMPKTDNGQDYKIGLPEGHYRIGLSGLDENYYARVKGGEDFEVRGRNGVFKSLIIEKKQEKTIPVKIKRNGYEGSFTLKLVGQDLMKTEQRVEFAAGETEKEARLSFIPSDLSLQLMEDGHYVIRSPKNWSPSSSDKGLEVTLKAIKDIAPGYVDRTALRQVVGKAREVVNNRAEYEPDKTSWGYIDLYLPMAEQTLIDETASQETIDKVCQNLKEGLANLRKLGESQFKLGRLEALVDQADRLTADDYTADSWQQLQEALQKAKDMLAKPDAERSQGDVDIRADGLEKALGELVRKDGQKLVDKSALEKAVADCEKLDEFAYTPDSWLPLQKALEEGQALLDKGFPDQKDLNAAVKAIEKAKSQLKLTKQEPEKSPVDKDKLAAAITAAQAEKESDYPESAWQYFAAALKAAEEVLADQKADQEKVNQACQNLQQAQKDLAEEKAAALREAAIGELSKVLAQAEGLKARDYTAESWALFVEVRSAAKALLENHDAADEALKDMAQRLTAAIEALSPVEEKPAPLTKAQEWDAMVKALPEAEQITLDDGARLKAIQQAYEALSSDDQAQVTEKDNFTARQVAYQALLDRQAADRVLAAIDQLPAADKVSLADGKTIAGVRAAYDGLSQAQQALIPADKLVILQAAEQVLKDLQATAAVDKTALKKALDAYRASQAEDYTKDSFARYKKAYQKAKAVYESTDAGQADVDKALNDLQGARRNLEEKQSSSSGGSHYYAPPKPATKPLQMPQKDQPTQEVKPVPQPAPEKPAGKSALRMAGYPDGTFRPDQAMTRAEMAGLLSRLLPAGSQAVFSDIPADAWYKDAAGSLVQAGLVAGYPDGSFRGNQAITRAEFVTIVVKWQKLSPASGSQFQDVAGDYWAHSSIGAAAAAGWVKGLPGNRFAPDAPLTRAQAVVILNRVLQVSTEKGQLAQPLFTDLGPSHWAYADIMSAHA